uniref:NADH-ubiquinone oxidoreductase chain 2 n=1 Tax=Oxypoda acuminata TaxID=346815 RepID=A0A0S2M812_9COLE|nr:NADH dehydrogenase subunit 2 [Oxypoda acuminata]ALO70807.1 NADH dehydrogenase subunit 2 [Oxypoda acuminata]
MMILMTGSLISISSNSWMGMWLGLEINLLAFIPLIQEKNNSFSSESSLKYFLTQALASIILLFALIIMSKNFMIMKNIENPMMIMFNSALLTKMGMSPFHFWFPEVIEGLNWLNCFILLTWQKITPMVLVMYNLNVQYFFMIVIILSMLISGIMGLNQTSLRKILAYSSINHMAWMIGAMMFSETIWLYYFIIYIIMTFNILIMFKLFNIFYYNQLLISMNNNFTLKFLFSFNFLSLGGLPPFLGFFPKWLTIQFMMSMNWTLLVLIMVMMTLLTLFYYTRLIFNIVILNNVEIKYYNSPNYKTSFLIFINLISLLSLIFFSLTFNFI